MKNVEISKFSTIEDVLLIGSFIGIAFNAFYAIPFCSILIYQVVRCIHEDLKLSHERKIDKELEQELIKVKQVSAQVEELQNSINNVRAAMSLGNRR